MACSFCPYEGKQKYLFISYSHQNARVVFPILDYLNQQGFRIWYDGGVEWGSEWPKTIANHLAGSDVCLAFHSSASIQSERCREELYYARKQNITVLSIYLEDVVLDAGLDMQLSSQQAIYLSQYKSRKDFLAQLCAFPRLQSCIGNGSFRPSSVPSKPPAPPVSASVPRLRLHCLAGEHKGEQFWIADHTTIGRDDTNRIVLSDARISRKHCIFHYRNLQWSMELLGMNGLVINGYPLDFRSKAAVQLSSGMVLTIFDDSFRIEIP